MKDRKNENVPEKDNRPVPKITRVFLTLLALCGWGCLVFSYIRDYSYAFPAALRLGAFFTRTVLNLCVPLALTGVCVIWAAKKPWAVYYVCYLLAVVCLVGGFVRSVGEVLYSPTVCSYTTDPENFGTFDKKLEPNIDHLALFPESIPNSAENVRYTYYFEEASADTVYIALSWQGRQSDIRDYLEKLPQTSITVNGYGETVYAHPDNQELGTNVKPYLFAEVIVDAEESRIAVVASSSAELLPQSMADMGNMQFPVS